MKAGYNHQSVIEEADSLMLEIVHTADYYDGVGVEVTLPTVPIPRSRLHTELANTILTQIPPPHHPLRTPPSSEFFCAALFP